MLNLGGKSFDSLLIDLRANKVNKRKTEDGRRKTEDGRRRRTRGAAHITEKAITETKGLKRAPDVWSEGI